MPANWNLLASTKATLNKQLQRDCATTNNEKNTSRLTLFFINDPNPQRRPPNKYAPLEPSPKIPTQQHQCLRIKLLGDCYYCVGKSRPARLSVPSHQAEAEAEAKAEVEVEAAAVVANSNRSRCLMPRIQTRATLPCAKSSWPAR